MNTINALSAITAVGSSTSDSGKRQQSQQQARPGQFLTATVLEPKGNGQFVLDIQGKKILAKGDSLTLSQGTKLKLEILTVKPELELRIVSKNPEMFFGKTLTLLSKNLDIRGLIQTIQNSSPPLFNNLSPSSQDGLNSFLSLQQSSLSTAQSGQNLKLLVERLGLNLESVFAKGEQLPIASQTLKAALLELSLLLKSGSELAETTNKLLGTIELYQLAQLKLNNDNLLLFPLPLPFLNHGYLLVDQESAKESLDNKSSPQQFSLHLNLEPLGNIEILFLDLEEGLYIRFSYEDTEKSAFARSHQDILKELISTEPLLSVSFGTGAENPAQSLIKQLIPDGETMLDTKV